MRVVIAGGHGKIALLLERVLAERNDQAVGLIRNPAQVAGVHQAGAEAAVCDLEAASAGDVAVLLAGADAVIFAAGAGTGSGAARKDTVDRAASAQHPPGAGDQANMSHRDSSSGADFRSGNDAPPLPVTGQPGAASRSLPTGSGLPARLPRSSSGLMPDTPWPGVPGHTVR